MRVNTLDAFVGYIKAGLENGEITDKIYLNVTSPVSVDAETPVNKYGRRKQIAHAERISLRGFSFGDQYDFENFVVALRSKFVPSAEQKLLLESLKQITNSNEVKTEDNGITQVVTARGGAALGAVNVQPIWCLRRTGRLQRSNSPNRCSCCACIRTGRRRRTGCTRRTAAHGRSRQ